MLYAEQHIDRLSVVHEAEKFALSKRIEIKTLNEFNIQIFKTSQISPEDNQHVIQCNI